MKKLHKSFSLVLVGVMAVIVGGLVGCDTNPNLVKELPAELVLWGDPDPDNNATFAYVRDINDMDYRHITIGANGTVQFSNFKICNVCGVDESTILINGEPQINIRFSTGPDGVGERRPFLVSADGFYIELVQTDSTISFQEEDVVFEENDDPSDDLAERIGTTPNPARAG